VTESEKQAEAWIMSEARNEWMKQIEGASMAPSDLYASDTDRVVAHYTTHPTYDALQKRIEELELMLKRGLAALPSDPPQSDNPDAPPKRGPVDDVVDALDKRLVGRTDRGRLRGALDKADAPLTGRAAGDEALKRISGLGALQGDRR